MVVALLARVIHQVVVVEVVHIPAFIVEVPCSRLPLVEAEVEAAALRRHISVAQVVQVVVRQEWLALHLLQMVVAVEAQDQVVEPSVMVSSTD